MAWYKVAQIEDIPQMGARKVIIEESEIAIFKTKDDAIFAINNNCPHKNGKLSEGLVHEHVITCPLHNWDIDLESGNTINEEAKCTKVYETKIIEGIVYISL